MLIIGLHFLFNFRVESIVLHSRKIVDSSTKLPLSAKGKRSKVYVSENKGEQEQRNVRSSQPSRQIN